MFAAVVPAGRLLRSNWISPVLPGALDAPKGPTGMVPRFPKFRASLVGLTYVSPKGPLELPHAAGASRAQTANTVEWTLVHRFSFVFMHNPPVKTARERFTRPVLEWDTWGQTGPELTFGLLLDHKFGWLAKAPAHQEQSQCDRHQQRRRRFWNIRGLPTVHQPDREIKGRCPLI